MRNSSSHRRMIIKLKMNTLPFLSLPFGGGLEGLKIRNNETIYSICFPFRAPDVRIWAETRPAFFYRKSVIKLDGYKQQDCCKGKIDCRL